MIALYILLVTIGAIAGICVLNGWVLSILWGWFLVPLGLAPISVISAIGIALILNYIQKDFKAEETEGDTAIDKFVNAITKALAKPLGALFVGWIITLFM